MAATAQVGGTPAKSPDAACSEAILRALGVIGPMGYAGAAGEPIEAPDPPADAELEALPPCVE